MSKRPFGLLAKLGLLLSVTGCVPNHPVIVGDGQKITMVGQVAGDIQVHAAPADSAGRQAPVLEQADVQQKLVHLREELLQARSEAELQRIQRQVEVIALRGPVSHEGEARILLDQVVTAQARAHGPSSEWFANRPGVWGQKLGTAEREGSSTVWESIKRRVVILGEDGLRVLEEIR